MENHFKKVQTRFKQNVIFLYLLFCCFRIRNKNEKRPAMLCKPKVVIIVFVVTIGSMITGFVLLELKTQSKIIQYSSVSCSGKIN